MSACTRVQIHVMTSTSNNKEITVEQQEEYKYAIYSHIDELKRFITLYEVAQERIDTIMTNKPCRNEYYATFQNHQVLLKIKDMVKKRIMHCSIAIKELIYLLEYYPENYIPMVIHKDYRIVARVLLDLMPSKYFDKIHRDFLNSVWEVDSQENVAQEQIDTLKDICFTHCRKHEWRWNVETIQSLMRQYEYNMAVDQTDLVDLEFF